jgi:hypothetical protein
MKDFKFFQKGTVDMMEVNETFITASFNDDTPEGHMGRRRLYHTDINQYERLRQSNNETEQYLLQREHLSQIIEDAETPPRIIPYQSHDIGLSNYVPPENESYYQRLFPQVTVTQVNPTFWTKVKIFGTGVKLVLKETWKSEPVGVVVVGILTTLITIIAVAKLLGL